MDDLYNEHQLKIYSDYLQRLGDEDDFMETLSIHEDMKGWISNEGLKQTAIDEMTERIFSDFAGELKKSE